MSQAAVSALERALTAWRAQRTVVLADAVEKAGAEVAKLYGPSDWDLARFDSHTLPRVLGWFESADEALLLPCLRHLATVLPDPRATAALLKLLGRKLPRPIERATVVARLKENGDPREEQLAQSLGVEAARQAAKNDEATLLKLATQRDAMLKGMFEKTDDLELRRVVADWLIELGDLLGELIALQLARGTRPASKAETELLREHGRALLHDLFFPGRVREVVFERGVPVHLKVASEIEWKPACASVRSLELLEDDGSWVLTEPWKRVRRVRPIQTLDVGDAKANRVLLEQLGEGKLTEFHPIEAVLLVRDGVIELFSIEGKPPFAWVTAVMKALTPKKIIVYLPKSSTAQLPAGLKGAEVKKLPAEKISALWAEREDEQG